jgi:outer membrane cobalamin receptor
MNDLYWPTDAFATGNPDLKPEKARNIDAGLYLNLPELSALPQISLIRCSVSYFRNSFRDRIQWTPGIGGKWSPQNLSEAYSTGMEAEVRVHTFSGLVSFGTNYTFLKAEDMLERQLVYRPKHSLGYSFRIGNETLWGQIQGLYRSRRYYTVQNTKWLEPFLKHDLQMGIERRLWSSTSAGLIFEIRNIFDTKYQHAADYPLPGREWSVKTTIGVEGE